MPAYEDETERSETLEYTIVTPGIIQKKAYNIQNTAKVSNQEHLTYRSRKYEIKPVSPQPCYYYYLFSLALQPSAGYGLLVHEVS
jgi:hypothetical protein